MLLILRTLLSLSRSVKAGRTSTMGKVAHRESVRRMKELEEEAETTSVGGVVAWSSRP